MKQDTKGGKNTRHDKVDTTTSPTLVCARRSEMQSPRQSDTVAAADGRWAVTSAGHDDKTQKQRIARRPGPGPTPHMPPLPPRDTPDRCRPRSVG